MARVKSSTRLPLVKGTQPPPPQVWLQSDFDMHLAILIEGPLRANRKAIWGDDFRRPVLRLASRDVHSLRCRSHC